jgi:hypothetical protein
MVLPGHQEARELVEWAPPLGVVSVYLGFDPDDRGGGWRTELRNGLAAVREGDGHDHQTASALRATAARIEERFANHDRSLPRGEVGFVEVAPKPRLERWWRSRVAPSQVPAASLDERPLLGPLLCLREREAARGLALLSADRVRLEEWLPGSLEEVRDWEITIFSRDWRERKAQRPADPARAQAVSSSGRDQFDERLEDNRRHFLGECGRLAGAVAEERGWQRLLLFGGAELRRDLCHGMPRPELAVEADDADLISEPQPAVLEHVEAAVRRLDAEREGDRPRRALERAAAGRRGAAGVHDVTAALGEARVGLLVLDAAHAAAREPLVRAALASGAEIAAVTEEAAEALAPADGVAALLRY